MIVTIQNLPAFIADTLAGIRDGVKKACEAGVSAELPDEVQIQVTVVQSLNGVAREQVTVPGKQVTTVEQLADDVTTHGRSNREERLNSGGQERRENSTTEES
jgi:hypothetical protein